MSKISFFLFIIVVILMTSCSKEVEEGIDGSTFKPKTVYSRIVGKWRVYQYIWGEDDVTAKYKETCGFDLYLNCNMNFGNAKALLYNDTLSVDGTFFIGFERDDIKRSCENWWITFDISDVDLYSSKKVPISLGLGSFGVLKLGGGKIIRLSDKELWFTESYLDKVYTIKLIKINSK